MIFSPKIPIPNEPKNTRIDSETRYRLRFLQINSETIAWFACIKKVQVTEVFISLHQSTTSLCYNTAIASLPMIRTIALSLLFSLSMSPSVMAAHSSSVALDLQGFKRSRPHSLRRCTSLTSDLSLASSLDDLSAQSQSTSSSYTPAHCKRLACLRSSLTAPLRSGDDATSTESEQRVYTRLQTQLYPNVRF